MISIISCELPPAKSRGLPADKVKCCNMSLDMFLNMKSLNNIMESTILEDSVNSYLRTRTIEQIDLLAQDEWNTIYNEITDIIKYNIYKKEQAQMKKEKENKEKQKEIQNIIQELRDTNLKIDIFKRNRLQELIRQQKLIETNLKRNIFKQNQQQKLTDTNLKRIENISKDLYIAFKILNQCIYSAEEIVEIYNEQIKMYNEQIDNKNNYNRSDVNNIQKNIKKISAKIKKEKKLAKYHSKLHKVNKLLFKHNLKSISEMNLCSEMADRVAEEIIFPQEKVTEKMINKKLNHTKTIDEFEEDINTTQAMYYDTKNYRVRYEYIKWKMSKLRQILELLSRPIVVGIIFIYLKGCKKVAYSSCLNKIKKIKTQITELKQSLEKNAPELLSYFEKDIKQIQQELSKAHSTLKEHDEQIIYLEPLKHAVQKLNMKINNMAVPEPSVSETLFIDELNKIYAIQKIINKEKSVWLTQSKKAKIIKKKRKEYVAVSLELEWVHQLINKGPDLSPLVDNSKFQKNMLKKLSALSKKDNITYLPQIIELGKKIKKGSARRWIVAAVCILTGAMIFAASQISIDPKTRNITRRQTYLREQYMMHKDSRMNKDLNIKTNECIKILKDKQKLWKKQQQKQEHSDTTKIKTKIIKGMGFNKNHKRQKF